ncbi:MAG: UvrD-helicase domain-containing protein [Hyphomicrobiales bacterium]
MSFTVYKSSAGSGKTYTLVKEYLKLALKDLSIFPKILAITFTNKAAQEMKDRIIHNLTVLATYTKHTDDPTIKYLLPELIRETNLSKEKISENAEALLGMILHNFSDFAIGTIDSFVHKIIRTFAHDLNIAINFEVEIDSSALLSQTIDLLIEQVGLKEDISNLLIDFVINRIDEEKSWNIDKDLITFSEALLNEDGYTYTEKLRDLSISQLDEIRKRFYKDIVGFEKKCIEIGKQAKELIDHHHLIAKDFYQGERGIYNAFKKLAAGTLKDIFNKNVEKTLSEDKWLGGKVDDTTRNTIESIKDQLRDYFERFQILSEQYYDDYLLKKEIAPTLYGITVLSELETLMHQIKTQHNVVHISEFNKRIANIVFNEPVPFIYERLGEHYKHFLIDEFQDTSVLQWRNMIPLIDNSLAENNFNMVVGDGKQAIYRWRNGEVSQFRDLPCIYNKEKSEIMDLREQALIRNYKEELLANNYRSKKEVIEFNNSLFEFSKKYLDEESSSIYENQKQEYSQDNKGGYIEISFIPKDDYEEESFKKCLETINDLNNEGYKKNDIAILCRNNKPANQLARFLLKNGVKVISAESLLIAYEPTIRLIITIFRILSSPSSKISYVEALSLTSLIKNNKRNMHEIMDELSKSIDGIPKEDLIHYYEAFFYKKISEYDISISLEYLKRIPLYEAAEEIIKSFKINETPDPYIITLLDEILKFTEKNGNSFNEFLKFYDNASSTISINIPEGINAVRIMTIHKSKGLEFPVVIFPFAHEKHSLGKRSKWVDWSIYDEELPVAQVKFNKSLEETSLKHHYTEEDNKSTLDLLNILYVALTRPSERLYVFTKKEFGNKISIQKVLKDFIEDKNMWDDNQHVYTFGDKEDKISSKDNKVLKEVSLHNLTCRKGRIQLAPMAAEDWATEQTIKSRQKGNLIHAILEKIISYEDLNKELDKFEQLYDISTEEKEDISSHIKSLIQHPIAKEWFNPVHNIYNEREIITPNGKSYRPDRIVQLDNKIIVIDYKTGKPELEHRRQIITYKNLIHKIEAINVEAYLVYLYPSINIEGPL